MNAKELERQERIDAHYRALAKNIWLFGIASVIVSLLIFFGMSSPSYSCPNITVTVQPMGSKKGQNFEDFEKVITK